MTHTQHLIAVVSTAACVEACALIWISGALYNALRGPKRAQRAPLGPVAVVVVIVAAIFLAIFRAVPTRVWRSL